MSYDFSDLKISSIQFGTPADGPLKGQFSMGVMSSYDEDFVEAMRKLKAKKLACWQPAIKAWFVAWTPETISILKDWDFPIPEHAPKPKDIYDNGYRLPENTLDFSGLKLQLRAYQEAGARRLAGSFGLNGLLADEMGLGKTITSLAAIWARREESLPALIVCPSSMKITWKREIRRLLPGIRAKILYGNKSDILTRFEKDTIYIINYDVLGKPKAEAEDPMLYRTWQALLKSRNRKSFFKTIILDEAHYIKNEEAIRTKAVYAIAKKCPFCICLTGTPVESRPKDIFTILHLLQPKGFPKFFPFGVRYCDGHETKYGWDFSGASHMEELHDLLTENVMIRRRKADVLAELPPKQRVILPVEISQQAYRQALKKLEERIKKDKGGEAKALAEIEACRQAAIDGKLKTAIEWISDYLESGRKLVVFATHTATLDALEKAFPGCARVDGSITGEKRQKEVDRFQTDEKCRLFIGNIRAAGTGLTLTAASDTLTLELDWTPSAHSQAEDRVHRIGQNADSVTAYYLIAQDTIEEDIMELLDKKMTTQAEIVDGENAASNSLLKDIFRRVKARLEGEKPASKEAPAPVIPAPIEKDHIEGIKKGRGGARPGAGRKKGVSYLPEEKKGAMRSLYLSNEVWDTLAVLAKDRKTSKSALVAALIMGAQK